MEALVRVGVFFHPSPLALYSLIGDRLPDWAELEGVLPCVGGFFLGLVLVSPGE
jgi:hypothetical protein